MEPFLGHVATLKRQMQDFEKIIERPKQSIDQKHIKKWNSINNDQFYYPYYINTLKLIPKTKLSQFVI